ncbi:MAG TPA: alkene reductase [Caulobacter sp.]|nr:alkene reductase [Caulobacter sp.]
MPSLFDPVTLGAIVAPNRILMAPLTRTRGTREHAPTDLMARYYAQRASAGLIVAEAIGVSRQGLGWPYATGLWRDDQVSGWRRVTAAVHEAGGRIVAQLWHMGRMVHPSFVDGASPVSASATRAPGRAHTYYGREPYAVARPLTREEIPGLVEDYRRAAANALVAGFDGVQVHAANGYLIDQFLRDNANLRTDGYGGAVENRIRLLCEVTRAVAGVAGADRTSVRLSPNGDSQGVNDSDPEPLFRAAGAALSDIGIGFLELREPPRDGSLGQGDRDPLAPAIREAFNGPLVLNSDYDQARAEATLASGQADAISFGRLFIANPDLPRRFAEGAPLARDDKLTWYSQGAEGYLDYPAA